MEIHNYLYCNSAVYHMKHARVLWGGFLYDWIVQQRDKKKNINSVRSDFLSCWYYRKLALYILSPLAYSCGYPASDKLTIVSGPFHLATCGILSLCLTALPCPNPSPPPQPPISIHLLPASVCVACIIPKHRTTLTAHRIRAGTCNCVKHKRTNNMWK
jgi:hypothetical protein